MKIVNKLMIYSGMHIFIEGSEIMIFCNFEKLLKKLVQ